MVSVDLCACAAKAGLSEAPSASEAIELEEARTQQV